MPSDQVSAKPADSALQATARNARETYRRISRFDEETERGAASPPPISIGNTWPAPTPASKQKSRNNPRLKRTVRLCPTQKSELWSTMIDGKYWAKEIQNSLFFITLRGCPSSGTDWPGTTGGGCPRFSTARGLAQRDANLRTGSKPRGYLREPWC
jgi:hypothetical protein